MDGNIALAVALSQGVTTQDPIISGVLYIIILFVFLAFSRLNLMVSFLFAVALVYALASTVGGLFAQLFLFVLGVIGMVLAYGVLAILGAKS